ncbi:winged helix-turn-helix domain-containing protein [Pedobacter rhizosphaerae]|uniref:Winged helix-turn-helix domain-containing protein n=1 Tax=Pedobacter rhizosphaerae TaxID=390241 RepID=A0A1H9SHS2_9SPHI|nr:crosslink repair DNA glycosylase YcaQ family protein [Pedobacter rhizosphaerae]SER84175.1 hypothetical protein SAMN04488023_11815 [Pedobacter rhizosphaerae]
MDPIRITQAQARKIILHAAGLARKDQFGTGIEAVYAVIDHLGFLQIDTNYVVERAHHQVLFSRISDYQTNWLATLTEEAEIFEYFSSDASYMPMKDFRFSLPVKESFETGGRIPSPMQSRLMKDVLDRIEREGPLMISDFENDRIDASSGWWDWGPAKVALERLYLEGKLMITRTPAFKKVYDLPLNLIPSEIEVTPPTAEEFARYVIRRTLGALGIASLKEIAWRVRRVKGNLVKQELNEMLSSGEIKSVEVDGLKTAPLYLLRDQSTEITLDDEAFILSPFDVLNVFRHRLKTFFNFDYQIECFVPAPKRKYGYFSLPIIIGDQFIARMDAKADRKQRLLIVHNIYFEEVELNEIMLNKLIAALKDFIQFNLCNDVVFHKSNHTNYLHTIQQAFS